MVCFSTGEDAGHEISDVGVRLGHFYSLGNVVSRVFRPSCHIPVGTRKGTICLVN